MVRGIAVAIALACGVVSALLSWNVLGLVPHIPDELSYSYQGRIFASGNLSVSAPQIPEAFTIQWDHILRESGKWRAIYPPGWPVLLCFGWFLGCPWLMNPVLLAIAAYGLFRLAQQLFDDRTAIFALIAFACSPFVLMMAAGFMAHTSALCFAIWCAFFLARMQKNDFIFAALCGATAFVIRPYSAVPLLLLLVLWGITRAENRPRAVFQLAVGAAPLLLLFCIYNAIQFGSVFRTGYSYDPEGGFRGSLAQHLYLHLPWYFSQLNRSLWGFPWPDLLIFLPLALPHKKWKTDGLLFLSVLSLLVAYSFFYYKDIVYSGPRFAYEATGFLAILAGRSFRLMEGLIQRVTARRRFWLVILLIFLFPLFKALPAQMQYHRQAYHGQSMEFVNAVEARGVSKNALILISGDPYVFRSFALENELQPEKGQRVYARDLPELREKILQTYGREEVWTINIQLRMLKGVNSYEDRAEIQSITMERLK